MRWLFVLIVSACFAWADAALAQTRPPALPSADAARGQAYYEFLMSRRLEADGDVPGALAALDRARKADPTSAEVPAEMAGLYARQNRAEEALKAANDAIAIEADNTEAHRVVALVYSAWAEGAAPPPPGQSPASLRDKAIDSLRRIQDSAAMATDLNLQVTYGRLLLRSGRPNEAMPVLEKITAQAPYVAEPFALIAEGRIALKQYDEAAEALHAAAEIQPRYYAQLGELFERMGRWADAADAYGEAVGAIRAPSRDLRFRWIGALLNIPGGVGAGRAKDALNDLIKANPKDTRALAMLASVSRQLGDLAGAEATAKSILAIDPDSLQGLSALSQAWLDRYEYRQVVDVLTPFQRDAAARAKGREREGAMLLVQLAIAQQQLARYDDAIAVFTAASSMVQRDPDFEAYVAQALIAARRYDRAAVVAGDALAGAPGHPRLTRYRAQALSRAGRGGEAVKLMETSAAAAPDSRDLALALADIYAEQTRFDDAIRVVQAAQARAASDHELAMRLGGLYEEAGRVADAEREFRKLIEQDPLDAEALNYLGYMFADRGLRLPESLALIQRAVKIDPENPAFLDSLGWAYFKMGRLAEADAPLAKSSAALPANSVIQDHHGDLLAKRGKWTEAVTAWERALAGDGESIDRAAIEKKIKDGRRRK